jgi:hypothetical protein
VSEPATGFDLKRAQRLVGVFAPVTIIALTPLALASVANAFGAQWVVLAVMVALVAGAGWVVTRGEQAIARVGAAAACLFISAVALLLYYAVWTYGLGDGISGLSVTTAWIVILVWPWIVLVVGGTVAARAGRYPGNARVTIWWIAALGAAGVVFPIALWMASNGIGDDMSPIVAFILPPVAACLWIGPAVLVGGLTLARRGRGAVVAPDAAAPPAPEPPGPPAEVTAT